ncbi:MAG TPA: polysaccharide pyruvyl transferase family protein [Candidatus Obscuribacterales bacterium]
MLASPAITLATGNGGLSRLAEALYGALEEVPRFDRCAFLDYPDHLNAGDHFIFVASVTYLTLARRARVAYTASLADFCPGEMERRAGGAPIFLQGGGNLGDLWPESQLFRERIISSYKDRPIVVLPQTVHFQRQENLRRASGIFNSHPDLTLFVRDRESLEIAARHFQGCRVHLAPDMMAALTDLPALCLKPAPRKEILYLTRADGEANQSLMPAELGIEGLEVRDWPTYDWAYAGRGKLREYSQWYWRLPGAVDAYREIWQRGVRQPGGYVSRLVWRHLAPWRSAAAGLDRPDLWFRSWDILHDCLRQLSSYGLIITSRLHGHLAASVAGIPNVLLASSYHKNRAFFETWCSGQQLARFAASPAQVRSAVDELARFRVDKRSSSRCL